MKDKPNFILYSNINKPVSRPKISEKYGNNLCLLFDNNQMMRSSSQDKVLIPNKKIMFNIIGKSKRPKYNKIENNMSEDQKKIISHINDFKREFYEYNQDKERNLKDFHNIKEHNDDFLKKYKQILHEKFKFGTGTYLDHECLIEIANKYSAMNIKIPSVSVDHNMFSTNPLIIDGQELDDYFKFNLGDKKKAVKFLNKVKDLVNRKQTGNYEWSEDEMKAFDYKCKHEKPKGYIKPKILIPQLKEQIEKSKYTINQLDNFDQFFNDINKERDKFSKLINNNNNRLDSPNSFFNKIYENKIDPNKHISFIKNSYKINYHNNKINKSRISTAIYDSYRGSSINNSSNNIFSYNNSNLLNEEKSNQLLKFPLYSAKYRNSSINISHMKNEISISSSKNSIIFDENSNLNNRLDLQKKFLEAKRKKPKSSGLFLNSEEKIKNIKKQPLIKFNGISSTVEPKKIEILPINRKKTSASLSSICKRRSSNNINDSDSDELIFNKESENETKNINNISSKEDLNKENDDKTEINKNNDEIKKNDDNIISGDEKNHNSNNDSNATKKESNIIEKTDRELEKIFNRAKAEDGYKLQKNKSDIEKYLKNKGIDIGKKITKKEAFKSVSLIKNVAVSRNYPSEEYKIRNWDFQKIAGFTKSQQDILKKNDLYNKIILDHDMKLKKILCESSIEKNQKEDDY